VHELSIAYSLVETAVASAQASGAHRVLAVKLELGALSGVVKDALLFGFDIAAKGTLLEGARLHIVETPVVIYCETCAQERTLESIQRFRCPVCGAPSAQVRRGRELDIVALEIESDVNSDVIKG
jgi:hydrogenase nickel incorporation protein HypA/HybF